MANRVGLGDVPVLDDALTDHAWRGPGEVPVSSGLA